MTVVVDNQRDGSVLIRFNLTELIQRDQRHDLAAVLNYLLTSGLLNGIGANFFQASNCRQRNCGSRAIQRIHNQPRIAMSSMLTMGRRFVDHVPRSVDPQHMRLLSDAEHVQNQRHCSVAHDRGTRISRQRFQMQAQWLHHDFLRIVDMIDNEAELAVFSL